MRKINLTIVLFGIFFLAHVVPAEAELTPKNTLYAHQYFDFLKTTYGLDTEVVARRVDPKTTLFGEESWSMLTFLQREEKYDNTFSDINLSGIYKINPDSTIKRSLSDFVNTVTFTEDSYKNFFDKPLTYTLFASPNAKTETEKIKDIYAQVVQKITKYKVSDCGEALSVCMNDGSGKCRHLGNTLLASLRNAGIKSRLVFGEGNDESHVWVRVTSGEPGFLGFEYDLDPTHYATPVPIPARVRDRKVLGTAQDNTSETPILNVPSTGPSSFLKIIAPKEVFAAGVFEMINGTQDDSELADKTPDDGFIETPLLEVIVPKKATDISGTKNNIQFATWGNNIYQSWSGGSFISYLSSDGGAESGYTCTKNETGVVSCIVRPRVCTVSRDKNTTEKTDLSFVRNSFTKICSFTAGICKEIAPKVPNSIVNPPKGARVKYQSEFDQKTESGALSGFESLGFLGGKDFSPTDVKKSEDAVSKMINYFTPDQLESYKNFAETGAQCLNDSLVEWYTMHPRPEPPSNNDPALQAEYKNRTAAFASQETAFKSSLVQKCGVPR